MDSKGKCGADSLHHNWELPLASLRVRHDVSNFKQTNKISPAFNHYILLHWMPNLCEEKKTCHKCRQEKVNVIEMTNVGSQTDYQSMDARGRNLRKCYDKALIYLSGLALVK